MIRPILAALLGLSGGLHPQPSAATSRGSGAVASSDDVVGFQTRRRLLELSARLRGAPAPTKDRVSARPKSAPPRAQKRRKRSGKLRSKTNAGRSVTTSATVRKWRAPNLAGPCYRHVPEAARRYNISRALLSAVIYVESRGRPGAISRVGAIGCMQLMPKTAGDLGVNPRNPRQNVLGGAKYLRRLERSLEGHYPRRWGFLPLLAAYNAGPGRIKPRGGRVPFRETLRYVADIRALVPRFETLWSDTPDKRLAGL